MSRPLFALCLLLFASTSMANNLAAGNEQADNNVKMGKNTAAGTTQYSEATASAQPATPARTSTQRVSPARWHSMLPGMIR